MNRQEAFEKAYADAHNLPLETFAQYRMGETYRLPLIAKCWRFWNAAIDSIVINLPGSFPMDYISKTPVMDEDRVQESIEDAGVKWQ